jgi:hypothetical protein
MEPQHDTPTPLPKVKYGLSQFAKPLPKFAMRLGAALTAMSLIGFGYQFMVDGNSLFAQVMAYAGAAGAFLTTFFGKGK